MNKRSIAFILLGILIIGGLFTGVFAGEIQRSLSLPMMGTGNMQPAARANPKATPTARATAANTGNQQQNQQNQQNKNQNQQTGQQQGQGLVLAQDTFHRQNQTLWGMASDGNTWNGDANMQQAFAINANTGQIAHAQGTLDAILGPTMTNVEVLAGSITNQFENDGDINFGVVLRWNDPNNWYKALIDGNHLALLKRVNGQTSTIKSVDWQAKPGINQMIRFKALGSMLFVKAWSSTDAEPANWMIVTSDMGLNNGHVGIRVLVKQTTTINVMSFQARPTTMNNGI